MGRALFEPCRAGHAILRGGYRLQPLDMDLLSAFPANPIDPLVHPLQGVPDPKQLGAGTVSERIQHIVEFPFDPQILEAQIPGRILTPNRSSCLFVAREEVIKIRLQPVSKLGVILLFHIKISFL